MSRGERRAGATPPRLRGLGSTAALLAVLWTAVAVAGTEDGREDLGRHRECGFCGMDRQAYGFSRAVVVYADGTEVGTCSLHCAVIELDAHPEKPLGRLRVADRDTHVLVDADAATWVMGGNKRAVMAARPKWAFATRAGAEAFRADHGGELVDWPRALQAAREDVAAERAASLRAAKPLGCLAAGR
jgi:nitrous oxide reductase accessory protein NosL